MLAVPEFTLYGYNIYECLEYRISSRTLVNIKNGRIKRLEKNKTKLLEYLLGNASSEYVYDEIIIINVFENYGLRCSRPYLLGLMKDLRLAFLSVGFDRIPITRFEGKAYTVHAEFIREIYTKTAK